jgi:hypothetical protein
MAWFRDRFCYPGTANSLCAVPVFVDDADTTVRIHIRLSTSLREQFIRNANFAHAWLFP